MALINHPAIPSQLLLLLALTDKNSEVREAARLSAQAKPNIFWQQEIWIIATGNVMHEALFSAKESVTKAIFNTLHIARKVLFSVNHLLICNPQQDSNSLY
ncbi:hypothetical protein D3C77_670050 [compost metagenome]